MLEEFKDLQNLYDSIEDLERVLVVPTDKKDVLQADNYSLRVIANEALKVVSNYKKLK